MSGQDREVNSYLTFKYSLKQNHTLTGNELHFFGGKLSTKLFSLNPAASIWHLTSSPHGNNYSLSCAGYIQGTTLSNYIHISFVFNNISLA